MSIYQDRKMTELFLENLNKYFMIGKRTLHGGNSNSRIVLIAT